MTRRMTQPSIGPAIPVVPIGDFSKFDHSIIEMAWQLVGPSAMRNLYGVKPVHLWAVIAAAYAEGMGHGAGIMREKMEAGRQWTPPTEP